MHGAGLYRTNLNCFEKKAKVLFENYDIFFLICVYLLLK